MSKIWRTKEKKWPTVEKQEQNSVFLILYHYWQFAVDGILQFCQMVFHFQGIVFLNPGASVVNG